MSTFVNLKSVEDKLNIIAHGITDKINELVKSKNPAVEAIEGLAIAEIREILTSIQNKL